MSRAPRVNYGEYVTEKDTAKRGDFLQNVLDIF